MNNLYDLLRTCPPHIKDKFIHIQFNTFEKIILQNESSSYVYIITKGRAKVYSLTVNGIKYLDHIYSTYELFGELEVFLNKPTLGYVEALQSCDVIKIPKDAFLEWLKYDSEFSLYINVLLAQKMYNTSINTKSNIIHPLRYRLLFFVWRFLEEHKLDALHKDTVVEGIGSNIRSVNRVIKDLCDDNIIEYSKGFIRIKDFDKLLEIINT